MMVVLLELLVGRVLSEKQLGENPKLWIERDGREWNQSEATSFKVEGKILHKMESFLE